MKKKIIRVSTVPMSLDLLLQGQLKMLAEKYEVVAVSSPGAELKKVCLREGVRTEAVPMERRIAPFKDLVSLWKLIRLFRKEKPWMVHSLTPKAGLLAMLAAKICGVPVRIHTFTGLVFPTVSGLKQKLLIATDRLTCACATVVNPEGKGVKRDLERFGITSKPLPLIGKGNINGIDLAYFDRTPEVMEKAKEFFLPEVVTFCFVGRIVRDKGMNELVEAFLQLYEKNQQIRLMLVGPLEEQLDPVSPATMQTIESHEAIWWMGWQEDIRPYLVASDVFVFPSYREGFPNVVMQAGAMGLPCIVTDINGCNEMIEEGVNGCIIPTQNVPAILQAMERMMDPDERRALTSQARPLIADRYERKAFWEALKAFYLAQDSPR